MSKLPVISGKNCIKVLGSLNSSFIDNVEVTSRWFVKIRPVKRRFLCIENLIVELYEQFCAKQASVLMNLSRSYE